MSDFNIVRAAMADPLKVEQVTGLKVHPAYYRIEPQGCRLLVAIEEVPEEFAGIAVPTMGYEKMGVGYVIGAGPFAGCTLPQGPMPTGMVSIPVDGARSPRELLYAHVIIGKSVGMTISVSFSREYPTEVVVIDEKDVKAIDFDSRPMKLRAEEGV